MQHFFLPQCLHPFYIFHFLLDKNPKPSESYQVFRTLVPKGSLPVLSLDTAISPPSPSTWQFTKSGRSTAACFGLDSFFCLNILCLPLLLSRTLILSARLKLINFPRSPCSFLFFHRWHDPLLCDSVPYRFEFRPCSLPYPYESVWASILPTWLQITGGCRPCFIPHLWILMANSHGWHEIK